MNKSIFLRRSFAVAAVPVMVATAANSPAQTRPPGRPSVYAEQDTIMEIGKLSPARQQQVLNSAVQAAYARDASSEQTALAPLRQLLECPGCYAVRKDDGDVLLIWESGADYNSQKKTVPPPVLLVKPPQSGRPQGK